MYEPKAVLSQGFVWQIGVILTKSRENENQIYKNLKSTFLYKNPAGFFFCFCLFKSL